MKKIKKNIYLLNLTLFLCTIISCTQNKDPIEVRIETHKINTYSLGDSLKIIESMVDSLIQVYSSNKID